MAERAGQGRSLFCVSLLKTTFVALAGLLAFAIPSLAVTLPHPVHRLIRRAAPTHKLLRAAQIVRHPIRHIAVRHTPVRHEPNREPVVRRTLARRRVPARARIERMARTVRPDSRRAPSRFVRRRVAQAWHGVSCVPFARADSGIDVAGNAYQWWHNAAGVYARGQAPVPGSVLAFRANTRMRLGHVAVVSRVINRREIEVDQSNWGDGGRITRGVPVIDVSENNDWTAVRVSIGDGRFGSVYPTHGFIYDRADTGTMMASRRAAPQVVALNPAPSDLRPLHDEFREVAALPGRLPEPPHRALKLGHVLHTSFVHRAAPHPAYHPRWTAHHAPVHHVRAAQGGAAPGRVQALNDGRRPTSTPSSSGWRSSGLHAPAASALVAPGPRPLGH